MLRLIISNCRPFAQSEKYMGCQLFAIESWLQVSHQVVLCNDPAEASVAWVTYRTSARQPPAIDWLVETALREVQGDAAPIAIVNADIILDPVLDRLADAVFQHKPSRLWAVMTKRLTYRPDEGPAAAFVDPLDNGLDFFCASRATWEKMLPEIPPVLTLGRTKWDSWVNSWFHARISADYYDITDWHALRHPVHEASPLADYDLIAPIPYLMECGMAPNHLPFPANENPN